MPVRPVDYAPPALSDDGHLDDDVAGVTDAMCCPISQDLMEDPVMADDHKTYNRAHIEAWFAYRLAENGHCDSPWTRQKVSTQLRPDRALVRTMDADPTVRLHRQTRLAKRARATQRHPTPPAQVRMSDRAFGLWQSLGTAGAGLFAGAGAYALCPMLQQFVMRHFTDVLVPTRQELRAGTPWASWGLGTYVGATAAIVATAQLVAYGPDNPRQLRAWAAAYAGAGGALGAVMLVPPAVTGLVDLAARLAPQAWVNALPPHSAQLTAVTLGVASGVLLVRSALDWAKRTVMANIAAPTAPLHMAG